MTCGVVFFFFFFFYIYLCVYNLPYLSITKVTKKKKESITPQERPQCLILLTGYCPMQTVNTKTTQWDLRKMFIHSTKRIILINSTSLI